MVNITLMFHYDDSGAEYVYQTVTLVTTVIWLIFKLKLHLRSYIPDSANELHSLAVQIERP
jgi:hypothetical protein